MAKKKNDRPKVFISYSWTDADHESWVIQLATDLEESGVHIILDKWDLREGADKYAFMEKMVTDPTVRKVIIVCDRVYAEKADGRMGGVGTETQIISQELYDQIDPSDQVQKFVAVITEQDENNKPFIPTFLKSRIYIDMSDSHLRTDNFEQLLRWIYDKPLFKRPEKGKPPAYLFEESEIDLGTTSRFRQAVDALKQNKEAASGICQEYFETFALNLEKIRIQPEKGKQFDDQVVESIESFLPYRDQIIDLFLTIGRYRSDLAFYDIVHRFFEQILPYGYWPPNLRTWDPLHADNFKFILNELFIYVIAALLKSGRFEAVNELLEQEYYFHTGSPEEPEGNMAPFTYFNSHSRSLVNRNKRLNLRCLSLMADILKQRAKRYDLTFIDVMQADFVLYIRSELQVATEGLFQWEWWPHSLVYATFRGRYPTFELFARAQSSRYFNQIKIALGVSEKGDLVNLIEKYKAGKRTVPTWEFDSINPSFLMNIEKIATKQ